MDYYEMLENLVPNTGDIVPVELVENTNRPWGGKFKVLVTKSGETETTYFKSYTRVTRLFEGVIVSGNHFGPNGNQDFFGSKISCYAAENENQYPDPEDPDSEEWVWDHWVTYHADDPPAEPTEEDVTEAERLICDMLIIATAKVVGESQRLADDGHQVLRETFLENKEGSLFVLKEETLQDYWEERITSRNLESVKELPRANSMSAQGSSESEADFLRRVFDEYHPGENPRIFFPECAKTRGGEVETCGVAIHCKMGDGSTLSIQNYFVSTSAPSL